ARHARAASRWRAVVRARDRRVAAAGRRGRRSGALSASARLARHEAREQRWCAIRCFLVLLDEERWERREQLAVPQQEARASRMAVELLAVAERLVEEQAARRERALDPRE